MPPERYFQNLPAEFIREWLPARVKNNGWPPESEPAKWRNVLGDTPERWRLYRWREQSIDIRSANWRSDVQGTLRMLGDACFRGISNRWTPNVSQSIGKISRIQNYAIANRALPGKLLIADTPTGLFLVDGNHRACWYLFSSELLGETFPVSASASCYIGVYESA